MSSPDATALFIDTGAFYARFKPDDENHEQAVELFDGIRSGKYTYRPLYTSRYVLSELATLLLRWVGHGDAVHALSAIRESESFTVLPVDAGAFDRTCKEFARYDDQQISFVDHSSAVLADEYDIEHLFAFDSDFRTLGFTIVPGDTPEIHE
ncbi:type II toxin-antitoxin system VapC family toxin [Natronococcus sp. JC468]|uniref:type II toxin-antitoxin system VapC family toxin n=1 Tax=Natronococcus sp. JC468 TaxID=1961921 RepID=UPI00143AB8CF|nr:PIN domain-containing protein [Natronococcus sp. JC468]NKE38084.1 type II toxin-antitoxin system VapC family toxin [Natronococcus sp. JC468]